MTKTISIITLFFIFALPLQAGAAEPLVLVQQTPQGVYDDEGSIDPSRVLAIGVGILLGGVAVGSTVNFAGSSFVGAVGGGLIANWWYGDGDDILALEPRT
jgi:hypothetical protein